MPTTGKMEMMMSKIKLQQESKSESVPSIENIEIWADLVMSKIHPEAEICIRIVDEEESAQLNEQYRNKSGSTNVLSFPTTISLFILVLVTGFRKFSFLKSLYIFSSIIL